MTLRSLMLGALLAGRAEAQVVSVSLQNTVANSPVSGAVLRLVRDTTVFAQALTNADGRAGLRAPHEGTYRVRVNRIGYAALLSHPVTLKAGETTALELRLASAPIVLPSLEAKSKSECGGPLNGNELAGVIWEQIRTALTASIVTQGDRAVPLRVRGFRRDLSTDARITGEVIVADAITRGKPYAAPPARTLIEKGFATLVDDEMTFSAPDADLFVSDEFTTTHCFRAVPGTTDSIVGLAFDPIPKRRQSDVRGTLWMNRATSELRFIEFVYVNIPVQLRDLGLGGRVDFARLPTGEWIINHWYIRMPRMAETPPDYRLRVRSVPHLSGFVEVGGRAEVTKAAAVLRAAVRGIVYDSTALGPLPGAVIRLVGNTDSVISNSDGEYLLVTADGGARTLTASHPKLGLMDDGSTREIMLSVGEIATAMFHVPSPRRMAAEFCGAGGNQSGIIGVGAIAAGPAEGLEVRVTWGSGASGEERGQTGPRGLFVFCDLPANQVLTLKVLNSGVAVTERSVTLKTGDYVWLELKPPVGLAPLNDALAKRRR